MAVYKDKTPTKDGRCWYFRTYKNGMQYKSKRYASKKEAINEEALFILKRDNPANKVFNLVAKDYFEDLEKTRKQSTVYSYKKDYRTHIEPFFSKMDISTIETKNIREWAEKLEKKGISVSYMNKIHNILNKIFDFAIKKYDLTNNPSRTYGTFQKRNDKITKDEDKLRYITFEEFQQFISVIDNIMWKTFFTFAYYTGCRRGEIIALKWDDVNFDRNEISINKTLYEEVKGTIIVNSTKNNKNRTIKMSKTLRDSLLEYKKEMEKYTDFRNDWYIFGNTRFLAKTTIANNKHKYFKLSGIKEITMHEFRHSHVSLLINEYIKSGQTDTAKFFLMMSARMGHTIQIMQETYMHLFPSIQDEIIDILNKL